ncbi:unnamed protein product [Linum tenue]|uniref:Protein kinase domain-containing protein n=1 Tax=Linum tenue TaxID=586396 RepID=A0AAV0L8S5_9ROSI|nr:unnamed protein product [Linum tenue]
MGLYNFTYRTYSPANKVVNVEFDSFVNAVWDPPFRHVGINNNSISSAVFAPWEVDSFSANPIVVEINYTASTHNLSVSWNYASVLDQSSSLSYRIDLRKVLPEWVAVGFTATTNQFPGDQELLWWNFSSTLEINQKDVANIERKVLLVLLAVPLGFAVAAKVIADGVGRSRKKKETIEGVSLLSINVEFSKGAGPRWVPYNDLVSATNNFSIDRKLGEGGFGGVYRGFLKDLDIPVAVKKFSRRSAQGIQEYITEVKVISRLRHRNLVKLIGWCHERGEFLLVYEFMPEGSLDSHLFANSDVYSFGVVCLEIVTGRRVVDYIEDGLEMGLVEWVWELYGNGNHSVAIDGRLVEFDEREVECLMVVGLWCAHPDSSQRASIRQAIQVLNFEAPFPSLPEKRPFPVFHVHTASSSSEESDQPLLSYSTIELDSR